MSGPYWRALLFEQWPTADPERRKPGRDSIVTVIEVVRENGELYVTFFDEWGQLQRAYAWTVRFLDPEASTHAELRGKVEALHQGRDGLDRVERAAVLAIIDGGTQ